MLDEDRLPLGLRRPRIVEGPRRASVPLHGGRRGLRGGLRAGRIAHQAVRRQLQLARTRLDADQLPAHRGPAEIPLLLRRRIQRRVPDGLRATADAARGRRRDRAPGLAPLPQGGGRRASLDRRTTRSFRRTRTSATTCCSTNTSTARPGAGSAPRTRPAGRRSWSSCSGRRGPSAPLPAPSSRLTAPRARRAAGGTPPGTPQPRPSCRSSARPSWTVTCGTARGWLFK